MALFVALLARGQSKPSNDSKLPFFGKQGFWVTPGNTALPAAPGVTSVLYPISKELIYYDTPTGKVYIPIGGGGVTYLPGKGLSLTENKLSIIQADQGSLGNIKVDRLIFNADNMPSLVTAEGLSLSNGQFLMNLGTTTVRMGIQDYRLFLQNAFGITTGGGGSGITWVDRPDTHTSPGKIGYASIWQDKLFVYGRETGQSLTQWFMLEGVVKNFSFDPLSQEGAPTATGTFDASSSKLKVNWSIARTDVISWDVFVSVGDSLHYNLEAGGLAAGLRSQDVQTYGGDKFYVKVRGRLTESGAYTPFSKQIEITRPITVDAYLPVINVVLTPLNGSNAIKVDFTTQDEGGEVVVEISSDPNATASSGSWTSTQYVFVSAPGQQSVTFTAINDYNARKIRIGRQGTKPPSAKQVFGPVSLTNVADPVYAPVITSITASADGTSATINYSANNTNYTRLDFYRSEDNGATYNVAIAAGNSGTSYTNGNLTPGKTYTYRPQVFKNGAYGPAGEPKSITMPSGGTSDAICNVTDAASGGNQVTTKSYTVTKAGTVNYMFDSGLIPDKLSVRKNGVVVNAYTATSWRTVGSIAVIAGDKLDFVINPQVTADQGTAWTFYANCSSAYNVDAPQTNFNYANADYPRIASITTGTNGSGGKTFTVNAIPAKNSGSQVVRYKAVMTFSGNTYQANTGWSTSNVLSTDQNGNGINASQFYTIYVQDAAGKSFAIAEVRDSKVYENDPASQPLQFSITNSTTTSLTVAVANPSKAGVINYNWAIYRVDGSQDGDFITNDNDIPSTATGGIVTINSGKQGVKPLVSGQQYYLYLAQSGANGLQSQTRNARITFTQPSGGSVVGPQVKALLIGNSITSHGNDPNQGWNIGDGKAWGMAATAADKDFASIVRARMKASNSNSTLTIGNGFDFERSYWNSYNYNGFQQQVYPVNLVILRMGDNVDDSAVSANNLYDRYSQLIDVAREANPDVDFIISTSFWTKTNYDNIVRQLVTTKRSARSAIELADLAGFDKSEYKAYSDWPNAATSVKEHPGNAGHAAIADKVWDKFKVLYNLTGDNPPVEPGSPGIDPPTGGPIQWGVVPTGLKTGQDIPTDILYMQNEHLRIGLNPKLGFSIYEAYHADDPNTQLVNDADYGRQWQYAYYSHPTTGYKPNGKDPGHPNWDGIGYDPIQAGDMCAGSQVLQYKYDQASNMIYFRTRPQLWGYCNIAAPCYVDTWIRIVGNFVEFRNILYNERDNDPQYVNLPRGQDIGGAFTNGKYYESNVYMGNKPWTDGPIVARKILYDFPFDYYVVGPKHDQPPYDWVYADKGDYGRTLKFYNPERWATLRNPESGRYVGLWSQSPTFNHQTGGREQGKWDGQYGGPYVTIGTMQEPATLAKRTILDYEYTYMIGGNPQIMRNYAYAKRDFKNVIDWNFSTGTSDWSMNNRDQAEPPFDGSWYAPGDQHQMNRVSPDIAVDASKYTHVQVRMAVGGNQQKAGISFLKRKDNGLLYDHDDIPYQFDVIADGQMRTYEIDLRTNPNYNGILYRIYLDVFGQPQQGRWSRVEFVKGIYRP
ncbi:hypothetical protein BWI97_15660 [Siphonobacter sp. BAB-5405]|nr:hypothetical protein BWI97_15660 [Siphonobacter sp. BAB-5405]